MGDLHNKEVISVGNGAKLGFVCDIQMDTKTASLTAIIVYGRLRLFGLLGREEDFVIPWRDIKLIGSDAILVSCEERHIPRKSGLLASFWEKW